MPERSASRSAVAVPPREATAVRRAGWDDRTQQVWQPVGLYAVV